MGYGGRPPKYKKEFHPENFIELSKQGKTLAQIAFHWDIARETIYDWQKKHREFSYAVKRGREFSESWYMELGQTAMLNRAKVGGEKVNINLGMFCWMTKNMFNWSDKIESKSEIELEQNVVYNAQWGSTEEG
jgi:transposase